MLFDSSLLFFHVGNVYNMTTGEAVSLVGATAASASSVINLGNPRDLGIGEGAELPKVRLYLGAAITSSCASTLVNFQFQGSTNSVLWTTYAETGANSTASWTAGAAVLALDVPKRPSGVGLPLYYQVNVAISGGAGTAALSSGSIIGGIVLTAADSAGTLDQYPAGFFAA